MKKIFIIFGLLFSCNISLANDSILSKSLVPLPQIAEVRSMAYAQAFKAVNKCHKGNFYDVSITSDTEQLPKNRDGKIVSGKWSEEWKINACGADVTVPIEFEQLQSRRLYLKYNIKSPKIN